GQCNQKEMLTTILIYLILSKNETTMIVNERYTCDHTIYYKTKTKKENSVETKDYLFSSVLGLLPVYLVVVIPELLLEIIDNVHIHLEGLGENIRVDRRF
ncbi:hypothetical protein PanWU01x14_302900, partial [Parasponia andersonii]